MGVVRVERERLKRRRRSFVNIFKFQKGRGRAYAFHSTLLRLNMRIFLEVKHFSADAQPHLPPLSRQKPTGFFSSWPMKTK